MIIYGTGTYFISKNVAQKLVNYFEENGITESIDVEMFKYKNKVNVQLAYYNTNISSITSTFSTMSNQNEKFILRLFKKYFNKNFKDFYYDSKLPKFRLEHLEFNTFNIYLIFICFIIILLNIMFDKHFFNIFKLIYFIFGIILWDIIDLLFVF